jgi:hypothetical protein
MDFCGISADYDGNAYIVGLHYGWDQKIPTTPGAYVKNPNFINGGNGFVTKIAPDGKSLVFSTYMEGSRDWEDSQSPKGIDVDGTGNVYTVEDYYRHGDYTYGSYVKKFNANGTAKLFD